MTFYCRLMTILFETIIAWYKASNLNKVRQDLPNLFFSSKFLKSEKCPFQLFLTTFKIALAAYTSRQNSCKILLQQKNICDRVHSYYNSNFKIHK